MKQNCDPTADIKASTMRGCRLLALLHWSWSRGCLHFSRIILARTRFDKRCAVVLSMIEGVAKHGILSVCFEEGRGSFMSSDLTCALRLYSFVLEFIQLQCSRC